MSRFAKLVSFSGLALWIFVAGSSSWSQVIYPDQTAAPQESNIEILDSGDSIDRQIETIKQPSVEVEVYSSPVQNGGNGVSTPKSGQVINSPVILQQQTTAPAAAAASAQSNATVAPSLTEIEVLKNERSRSEVETEDSVRKRIEAERLRDELDRRRRVEDALEKSGKSQVVEEPIIAPAVQAQPAAPVVAEPVAQVTVTVKKDEEDWTQRISVGPYGGYTWYARDSVSRFYGIENQYTLGVRVNMPMSQNFVLEGNFSYANYRYNCIFGCGYGSFMAFPTRIEKDQFLFGVDGRFNIFTGRFRPFVGGGVNYVLNSGRIRGFYGAYGNSSPNYHYFAGDLMAGLEVQITKNISLDGRFAYLTFLGQNNNWWWNNQIIFADQSDMFRATGAVNISF